jgi:4,5-dihydroxyphthalate decarboxylase
LTIVEAHEMSASEKLRLNALMGTYPKTHALKSGALQVEGVELTFAPIDEAMKGFKSAVRELKYAVCELALSTFLQARSVGKPFLLMPFVMNGKFHHGSLLRRADNQFSAHDLNGRKVAMRSYSQTTPTWVRGFLMDDFGTQVDKVQWLVKDDGHVAECKDPPWVSRMQGDKDLVQALVDGDVDAILFSAKPKGDDRVATVLDDPKAAAQEWAARNDAVPINHMVVIRKELADERPDIVRALYQALIESRQAAEAEPPSGTRVLEPHGFANVQPALEIGIRYAVAQGLIPMAFTTDELYGSVRDALSDIE